MWRPVESEIWWAECPESEEEDMVALSSRNRLHVEVNKVVVLCLCHVEPFEYVT